MNLVTIKKLDIPELHSKKEGEQQKPKSIKQISPPVNTQTKEVSFTRPDDNRDDFGDL